MRAEWPRSGLATAHGDSGFTRRVAIKRLFPRAEEGGAFERMFLDEARITSRLHHAAIVSIVDFGVEEGRPFQVLELVDGFDAWRLTQWGRAQGKPLSVGLALHLCAVVGHALHFAHVATDDTGQPLRIVHRDVSPQNILVSRSGDVKLSDFGIAFAEGRAELTVGGIARGKPALARTQLLPAYLTVEPRTALSAWVKEVSPEIIRTVSTPSTPKATRNWSGLLALLSTLSLSPDEGEPSPPPPVIKQAEPQPEVVVVKPEPPPLPRKIRPAPEFTGVFTVGGETLLRGEVFVDGTSRGFAPTRLELPVGPHRVEVLGRDGVKHGPREVQINRQHTQSSPLSWEE